jgi:hypothetical protein
MNQEREPYAYSKSGERGRHVGPSPTLSALADQPSPPLTNCQPPSKSGNKPDRELSADSCAESLVQSPKNSSRQEAASTLLDEFKEWLAAHEKYIRRVRSGW